MRPSNGKSAASEPAYRCLMERPCPGCHHLSALVRVIPCRIYPDENNNSRSCLPVRKFPVCPAEIRDAFFPSRERKEICPGTNWPGMVAQPDPTACWLSRPLGNYVTALVSHSYPVARGYLLASRWCGFLRRSSLPISSALISAILSHRGKQRLPTAQQHPSRLW